MITVEVETKAAGRRARKPRRGAAPGTQLSLEHVSNKVELTVKWGGKRKNAGRKLAPGKRRSVAHRRRVLHTARHPVHVTLRAWSRLPSLRSQRISELLRVVLFRQRNRKYAGDFHVVEFSIQDDHLHLIVEATGEHAAAVLRSGISGFVISFAKRLNAMLGRKGKVWADRWHGRELASPTEVRHILGYVFRNVVKHGARVYGQGFADPFSSAPRFDGWTTAVVRNDVHESWPPARPRTWLLEKGWRLQGLLDPAVMAGQRKAD